jgi:hypothetical protein
MIDCLLSPQTLVYSAGALYIFGLVIVNQMVLRILVLAGTAIYVAYYWTVADTPLWEAIYISFLIGLANIIGIFLLMARRSRLAIPAAHADIRDQFATLPPGDFRALMRMAKRYTLNDMSTITMENAPGSKLYYVISGVTTAEKGGHQFDLPPQIFIGEVAYIIG